MPGNDSPSADNTSRSLSPQRLAAHSPGDAPGKASVSRIWSHRNGFIVLNILCAVCFAAVAQKHLAVQQLLPWVVFIGILSIVHFSINQNSKAHEHEYWLKSHQLLSMFFGISWAYAAQSFLQILPEGAASDLRNLLVSFGLVGSLMLAASTSAMLSFAIPLMLGLILSVSLASQSLQLSSETSVLYAILIGIAGIVSFIRNARREDAYVDAQRTQRNTANQQLALKNTENDQLTLQLRQQEYQIRTLQSEAQRSGAILRSISDGVISCDGNACIEYMNPVAEVLTGWRSQDALGQSLDTVFKVLNLANRELAPGRAQDCLNENRPILNQPDDALVRKDGLEYAIEYMLSPIRGTGHTTQGLTAVFRDVTAQRAISNKLAWQSSHDPLTRLINRVEFERQLGLLLSSRSENPHALCVFDFDCFKGINDSHGINVGDELIRKLSRSLLSRLRETDVLARIGGDELALLIRNCTLDKARMITEGLRLHIEQFGFLHDGMAIPCSASMGLVAFQAGETDISGLIAAAEHSCTQAKLAGGAQVAILDSPKKDFERREALAKSLSRVRRALDRDELDFIVTRIRPSGHDVEINIGALELRFRQADTRGDDSLNPAVLQAARKYQLLPELDLWMVKAACDALRLGHPSLTRLDSVILPIHAQSLRRRQFRERLLAIAADVELADTQLIFGIHEAGTEERLANLQQFLIAAGDLGIQCSLNDVGSPQGGSIEMLRKLNVDYMQLDADLIDNVANDGADFELLLALTRLARIRGIQSIAPAVGNESNWASLVAAGVDFLSGTHTSDVKAVQTIRA